MSVQQGSRQGEGYAKEVFGLGYHYYALTTRNKLWYAYGSGLTPGTTIGTAAPLALYNRAGSNVNVVVVWAMIGYQSGTLGAGFFTWCINQSLTDAVPTGTAVTLKTGQVASGVAPVGAAAVTTATLSVIPVAIRPAGSIGPILATSVVQGWQLEDLVDGAIVLPPGASTSLQFVGTAGATPNVAIGIALTEEPL